MENTKRIHYLLAGIAFLISMVQFYLTVANTVPYWDCGEFIACSYTLGIPHPPGSPLWILIGKIFSWNILIVDKAMRINIVSGILSAFTVLFVYLIIVRMVTEWRGQPKNGADILIHYGGAFIGALTFSFTDSFWFNGVEAEVYAASIFFTAIVVWLIMIWEDKPDDPHSDVYILLIAYMVGLAIGVHLLNVLALPTVFLVIYYKKSEINVTTFIQFSIIGLLAIVAIYPGVVLWLINIPDVLSDNFNDTVATMGILSVFVLLAYFCYYAIKNKRHTLSLSLISLLLILIGYSTYALIMIRSGMNPRINENAPYNWNNMVKYLNREQYGTEHSIMNRVAPFWDYQVNKMYIRYFLWQFVGRNGAAVDWSQFYGIPLFLGIFGMIHHLVKDRKWAFANLILFIMTGIAVIIYLNQPDPQPRERDYSYVGSFLAFAIWIGIGVTAILEWIVDAFKNQKVLVKPILGFTLFIMLLIAPFNMARRNWKEHDRNNNYVAYDYSYNILQSCDPNGIIFTNGDNDTFPLWYLQEVEGIRRDIRIVNLSLLNTDWYIYQLKHDEPKVPTTITDEQIPRVQPIPWKKQIRKIEVPSNLTAAQLTEQQSKPLTTPPQYISFEIPPTLTGGQNPDEGGLRVQDYMVFDVLASSKWQRPVYFAVTVANSNMLGGLRDYIRMDGLAFKIVPEKNLQISPEKLQENLFNKFLYRHLNDPKVFYDDNIQSLLQNYRSAFLQLADYYARTGQKELAEKTLNKMEEVLPEKIIPFRDSFFGMFVGKIWQDLGKPEKARERMDSVLKSGNLSDEDQYQLGLMYLTWFRNYDESTKIFEELYTRNPQNIKALSALVNALEEGANYQKAISLLEKWMIQNPGDPGAEQKLRDLKAKYSPETKPFPNPLIPRVPPKKSVNKK